MHKDKGYCKIFGLLVLPPEFRLSNFKLWQKMSTENIVSRPVMGFRVHSKKTSKVAVLQAHHQACNKLFLTKHKTIWRVISGSGGNYSPKTLFKTCISFLHKTQTDIVRTGPKNSPTFEQGAITCKMSRPYINKIFTSSVGKKFLILFFVLSGMRIGVIL